MMGVMMGVVMAGEGAGKNEKLEDRKPQPLWSSVKSRCDSGVRALTVNETGPQRLSQVFDVHQ